MSEVLKIANELIDKVSELKKAVDNINKNNIDLISLEKDEKKREIKLNLYDKLMKNEISKDEFIKQMQNAS